MNRYRMFAFALLSAVCFNCTVDEDGSTPTQDPLISSADQGVADSVVAVFDAHPLDGTHSYYELRFVEDGGTAELRGFGSDGERSRATIRPFFDPDGQPWMRLSVEDEQIAFEGHVRWLRTELGDAYVELDAEVEGQIVSIRADPNDPTSAEIYGFPGLAPDRFVPLAGYEDPSGLLSRLSTSLARYQTMGPQMAEHFEAYGGDFQFRFDECFECFLFLPSAGFQGVACLGALAVATVTCNMMPNACPGAQMTAAAVCGQAIGDIADYISDCKATCRKAPVDPCSGGCSCPGGPA